MERAPDWSCPNVSCVNSTKMVFGSKANCPKCGSGQPGAEGSYGGCGGCGGYGAVPVQPDYSSLGAAGGPVPQRGMQGGDMDTDWSCSKTDCINHTKMVFGKKASCPSCGTARHAKNPGDWTCPNDSCVNSRNTVFGSKQSCPKCGTPKPASFRNGGIRTAVVIQAQPAMQYYQPRQGGGGYGAPAPPMYHYPAAPPVNTSQNGDWECPDVSCINHRKLVFGKNETCPKCNSAKPAQRGRGAKDGDWPCPNTDCKNNRNNVFGKHESCPQCGEAKPAEYQNARGRSRSPLRPY